MAKKIEFKDEIMTIYHRYHNEPEILKPDVKTRITKQVYTGKKVIQKDLGREVCLHNEVIAYADNDT